MPFIGAGHSSEHWLSRKYLPASTAALTSSKHATTELLSCEICRGPSHLIAEINVGDGHMTTGLPETLQEFSFDLGAWQAKHLCGFNCRMPCHARWGKLRSKKEAGPTIASMVSSKVPAARAT